MPEFHRSLFALFVLVTFVAVAAPEVLAQKRTGLAVESFQITTSTLQNLRREGFPESLLSALGTLKDRRFLAKNAFVTALGALSTAAQNPDETELILHYAGTERLRIEADEFSSDLNAGEAMFRGNVHGWVARENLEFTTLKLRINRQQEPLRERLTGEGVVWFRQWNRELNADYMVFERGWQGKRRDSEFLNEQTLQLEGNVRVTVPQGSLRTHKFFADFLHHRTELEGLPTPEGRFRVEANLDLVALPEADEAAELRLAGDPNAQRIIVQAYRAVLDTDKGEAVFEGQVEMERTPEEMFVRAERISLHADKAQRLQLARAEQDVCLQQPGRVARAKRASFDELTKMIVLEGDAEVLSGQYYLRGNRINLFLDVNRGFAQGDETAPIEVTILMNESDAPTSFSCR